MWIFLPERTASFSVTCTAGGPAGSFYPEVITRSEVAAAEAFNAAHLLEGIWESAKELTNFVVQ